MIHVLEAFDQAGSNFSHNSTENLILCCISGVYGEYRYYIIIIRLYSK